MFFLWFQNAINYDLLVLIIFSGFSAGLKAVGASLFAVVWLIMRRRNKRGLEKTLAVSSLPLKRQSQLQQMTIFFFLFSEKTSLDILCESSAEQTIHTKCRLVFSENIFLFIFQRKQVLTFHVNHLLADDSHEMSRHVFSEK